MVMSTFVVDWKRSSWSICARLAIAACAVLLTACSHGPPELTIDPGGAGGVGGGVFPDEPIHRDLDELWRVKYGHVACEGHADCPTGSYCAGERDSCQWQCLADSDCAPDQACDALGRCAVHPRLYKSNNLDECLAQDPATRRKALVGDGPDQPPLNDQQRTCNLGTDNDNDDCPCGSYCDINATCHVQCIADPSPPAGYECGAGEKCTPSGRCVPSASTADGPALQVSLEIAPIAITANTVLAPSALQPVTVRVSVNSEDFLSASHPAKVRYSLIAVGSADAPPPSGPNPTLSCDPNHAGPLTATCDLDGGWVFDLTANSFRSQPRTIWIQIPQSATERRWLLVARSESAADPATAAVNAMPVVIPTTDPGHYTGQISWTNPGAPAGTPALSLPVEAVVTASHVALVEPTRIWLADGHATLPRDPSKAALLGWLGATIAGAAQRYDVRIDLGALSYDAGTGHLTGALTVTNGSALAGTQIALALDRTGDVDAPTCPVGGSCAAGSYCDAAMTRCLPGTGPASGAGIVDKATAAPSQQLASAQIAAWAPAMTKLVADNATLLGGTGLGAMARAYCYQPGETLPAKLGVTGAVLAGPAQDFGCMQGSAIGTPEFTQRAFKFAQRTTEVELQSTDPKVETFNLLDNCLADLAVTPPGAATRANTLDANRACASVAQALLALDANVRPGAAPALERPQVKLVTQVLRQWLGAHGYVANGVVQNRRFDDALGRSTQPADQRLGSAVDLVDQGLRLMLDPSVRAQYSTGTAAQSVAANPDYRLPEHPTYRWSFNGVTSSLVPGIDGGVGMAVGSAITSSNGLQTPNGSTTCGTTDYIFLPDDRFTISFYLANPIQGATLRLFEKQSPDGTRLWVEAVPGAPGSNQLNLTLKDQAGRAAVFTPLTSATAVWGLLAFVADGGSYRLLVAPPQDQGKVTVLQATSVLNGGPRWAFQGVVKLGCDVPRSCQAFNSCTSWDLNAPGDAGDVHYSSGSETGWVKQKTCVSKPKKPQTCTGSLGTQGECDASASAKRTALINGLFANPPASAVDQLSVIGTMLRDIDTDQDEGILTTKTTDTCILAVTNLPSPGTQAKPVCDCMTSSPPWAPQGVFYDDLTLWSRPLDPDEFAAMAARYAFTPANETIGSGVAAGGEQATGLAAHLVEAAGADLNLLTSYVDAARGASYSECYLGGSSPIRAAAQDRAGRNLRLVAVLEAEAARLATAPGSAAMPWYARFQAGQTVLAANRAKALQELQQLTACKNPLAISETELPLYVGQDISPADRFFATTHFLTKMANDEITAATASLNAARLAYNAQVTADFTQQQTTVDHQVEIEKLKVSYDGVLRRYCGAPSAGPRLVDLLVGGQFDARSCFFKSDVPGCQNLANTPIEKIPPSCLRGEIGQRVVEIQAAAIDIASARNAIGRAADMYHNDTMHCIERQAKLESTVELLAAHMQTMYTIRDDQTERINMMSFVSMVSSMFTFDAASMYREMQGWVLRETKVQVEIDKYELEKLRRSNDLEVSECYFKADNDQFALGAAFDVLSRAFQQATAAAFAIDDARSTLTALIAEAAGQLSLVTTVDRRPPHLHYWTANEIDTYDRHMAVARRLSYLAVRAFEYEGQQSSTQRGAVLTARQPSDLAVVTQFLAAQTAPLSGGQFHFGQHGIVLSLRDEVLHLEDLSTKTHLPDGQPPATAITVLQHYLTSDSSRIYNANGDLMGRGVRFSIRPEFWSSFLCAERIVHITPYVSVLGGRPDHTETVLIQDNAFGSQVCGAPAGDVAITRVGTKVNLITTDTSASFQPPQSSTAMAMTHAPSTVNSRVELENLPFGAESDFAGRGLYGEYVLVFPDAPACSPGGACAGWSKDKLAKVQDIFLKFDIVDGTQQSQ
jgi:hypothetical protein